MAGLENMVTEPCLQNVQLLDNRAGEERVDNAWGDS